VIHIAHALVADEGGKPGLEEVQKEEEEEEHIGTAGFDVAVHRVESSSEGDSMEVRRGNKTAPVLNLDCFHTGISSDETSATDSSSPLQVTPNNSPVLTRRTAGGLNIFPQWESGKIWKSIQIFKENSDFELDSKYCGNPRLRPGTEKRKFILP